MHRPADESPPAGRVFIASELMHPELTSTGYYVSAIARDLARAFPVTVLCGQPTYAARGTRAPRREHWHGVAVRRCWGTTFDKNRIVGRLANMVTLGTSLLVVALRLLRPGDVVLAVSNPPILPPLMALACWWRRASCVPVIHDHYPDLLVVAAGLTAESRVVRTMRWMNRRLFSHARRIVVVGRDMKARLVRHHPEVAWKVLVHPNWAEVDAVRPADWRGNRLRAALGLEDVFVLMYAGNVGHPQELHTLVEAADRLRSDPSVHFVIVGDGARWPWLVETVRRRDLRNVTCLGSRPREHQQEFLAAANVGLVTLVRGMQGVSVPSRLYNFLAAGRPIIGLVERDSEVDLVIREEGVGWSTAPGDVEAFVAAIREASSDEARLCAMGTRAREAADRHYAGRTSLAQYRALVSQLMTEDAPA